MFTTSEGINQVNQFFYLRSSPKTLMTGSRSLVKAGQTQLVTPFSSWSQRKLRKQRTPNWYKIINRGQMRKFVADQLKNVTSATVQLDAIVYADWVVVGPDSFNLATHLTTRRNAEHDEAVSILKLTQSGATHAAIRGKLNRHLTVDGVAGAAVLRSDATKYWYFKSRSLQAKMLLKRFKQSNRAGFIEQLSALRNQPKTGIKQAIS